MCNKNINDNSKKDKGLIGNEKIEEAIFDLQKNPNEEELAHTLTVIRQDRKSTRLNSSHSSQSRMPSSA